VAHLLIALWRLPGVDAEAVRDRWLAAARTDDNVRACTISLAEREQGRFGAGDPVDVLIGLEVGHAADLGAVPAADMLAGLARRLNAWEVEPYRPIVTEEPTAVKMVSFVARAEHLTRDEFVRHWTEQHAPLARRHHVGLADYTQNVVRRALTPGGGAVDGIAELRFRTRDDFEHRFYDSDEGRALIRRDVQRFIARPSGEAALMREARYDLV
jgi:uncharacterized protein (TIGR02118 family)